MRASTIEELGRDPVDRYVVGASFVHFCAAPDLWGVILFGTPSGDDALQLGRSLVMELSPPAVKHRSVVDASRLQSGSIDAFAALERYVAKHGQALGEYVQQLAIVRPTGLTGALVAGAQEVLSLPYPVSIFADAPAAMKWLEFALDLDALFGDATGTPPMLVTLRAQLDRDLRLPIDAAAKSLAMSERSLQRKLGDLGTTFHDEQTDARVRAAQRLLQTGDAPLTTIALDVGCATLQHFNTMFKKRTGMLPSEWRKSRRG